MSLSEGSWQREVMDIVIPFDQRIIVLMREVHAEILDARRDLSFMPYDAPERSFLAYRIDQKQRLLDLISISGLLSVALTRGQ